MNYYRKLNNKEIIFEMVKNNYKDLNSMLIKKVKNFVTSKQNYVKTFTYYIIK